MIVSPLVDCSEIRMQNILKTGLYAATSNWNIDSKTLKYSLKWHRYPYWPNWGSIQQHQLHIYYGGKFCIRYQKNHPDSWLLSTYDCSRNRNTIIKTSGIQPKPTTYLELNKCYIPQSCIVLLQTDVLYSPLLFVILSPEHCVMNNVQIYRNPTFSVKNVWCNNFGTYHLNRCLHDNNTSNKREKITSHKEDH
jgi:hypothetical protein